jgi:hypothetical protein
MIVQLDAAEAIQALSSLSNSLDRELNIILGATAKKAKSFIAKAVSSEVMINQKAIRNITKIKESGTLERTITLKKTARVSLKEFSLYQTKGAGITYRIAKGGAKSKLAHGFVVKKLGGHGFKRIGKTRLPIAKLHGPSPWGVFIKHKKTAIVKKQIDTELSYQFARRLQYLTYKQSRNI